MEKPTVAVLMTQTSRDRIIATRDAERLAGLARTIAVEQPQITSGETRRCLRDADGCITSWGSLRLTPDILKEAPRLRILVHAAGSVKPVVSEAIWKRGIKVTSCAPAIAVGVAEHSLGLMLSAMKRTYWYNDFIHRGGWANDEERSRIVEIYGIAVGIVGLGYVGRHMLKLLRNFDVEILCYDPFAPAEEIEKLGGKKIENLDELMSRVDILSLHAPSLPETRHMINRANLKLLKDGAILINTARGSLIDEEALYEELKTGRITACLDVTDPEPPAVDHPLRRLPNVIFTPHIAGGAANNRFRIGNFAVTELERFFSGRALLYPVQEEDLARVA